MAVDGTDNVANERSPESVGSALDQQIAEHKSVNEDQSVLSWAVSQLWRKDEDSLKSLEKLHKDVAAAQDSGDSQKLKAMEQQVADAIAKDENELNLQNEISHYGGQGLKTAALFFGGTGKSFLANRGTHGLVATAGLYGMDETKINDPSAVDFLAGSVKGGLTKGLFQKLGSLPIHNPAGKGILLGTGARVIDTAFTPDNYKDAEGNASLSAGLGKVGDTVTDVRAMAIDAALFGAAHGITRGANFATRGAVDKSPLANTIMTSGSFGLSAGGYHELERQMSSGQPIDYADIAKRAFLQGGIDMIAGVPGGVNADVGVRKGIVEKPESQSAAEFARVSSPISGRRAQELEAAARNAETTNKSIEIPGQASAHADSVSRLVLPGAADGPAPRLVVPGTSDAAPAPRVASRPSDEAATSKVKAEDTSSVSIEQVRTRVDEVKAGTRSAEDLARDIENLSPKDLKDLYLENFDVPKIRTTIESVDKPPFAMELRVAEASEPAQYAYQKFELGMSKPRRTDLQAQSINELISSAAAQNPKLGAELRGLIDNAGRTAKEKRIAEAVDMALGTNYAENYKPPSERLSLSEKEVEYLKHATRSGSSDSKQVSPEFEQTVQAALNRRADAAVESLRSGTVEQRIRAAEDLAVHVKNLKPEEFKEWAQYAADSAIPGAYKLKDDAVQTLIERSPEQVQHLIGNEKSSLRLDSRFDSLATIAEAFKDNPGAATRLMELTKENPDSVHDIAARMSGGFGAGAYRNWLMRELSPGLDGQKPLPALENIAGDHAVREARFWEAFGDTPQGAHLQEFARVNPDMADSILRRLPRPEAEQRNDNARPGQPPRPPKGQDFLELLNERVQQRLEQGIEPTAKPEQLNADALGLDLRLGRSYSYNQPALEKLRQFAVEDPTVMQDILSAPGSEAQRSRDNTPFDRNDPQVKLGRAWGDLVGILAPKATDLAQLQALRDKVGDVVRLKQGSGDSMTSEIALNRMVEDLLPANEAAKYDAMERLRAVVNQDANLIPRGRPPQSDAHENERSSQAASEAIWNQGQFETPTQPRQSEITKSQEHEPQTFESQTRQPEVRKPQPLEPQPREPEALEPQPHEFDPQQANARDSEQSAAEIHQPQLRQPEAGTQEFVDSIARNKELGNAHKLDDAAVQSVFEQAPEAVQHFIKEGANHSLGARIDSVSRIAEAFEHYPEAAGRLFELAREKPDAIFDAAQKLSGQHGEAYQRWLEFEMDTSLQGYEALPLERLTGPDALLQARIYDAMGYTQEMIDLQEHALTYRKDAEKQLREWLRNGR